MHRKGRCDCRLPAWTAGCLLGVEVFCVSNVPRQAGLLAARSGNLGQSPESQAQCHLGRSPELLTSRDEDMCSHWEGPTLCQALCQAAGPDARGLVPWAKPEDGGDLLALIGHLTQLLLT